MDGYTIADWLESRHQGPADAAKFLLNDGDGGDKLYAIIYLLIHGISNISDAYDVIERNCETSDTCSAWQAIAWYVSDKTAPLFTSNSFLEKSKLQDNVTFYNLLPLVIRNSDKPEAIHCIERLVTARPELRSDMEEVVARIKSR